MQYTYLLLPKEARGSPRIDTVSEWSNLRRANVQNLIHGACGFFMLNFLVTKSVEF